MITPDEVLRYLADVDYPAGKDVLVAAAERAGRTRGGGPQPPGDPAGRVPQPGGGLRSVPVDPGAGRSAGRAAEQARTRAPAGVAEHLREPR